MNNKEKEELEKELERLRLKRFKQIKQESAKLQKAPEIKTVETKSVDEIVKTPMEVKHKKSVVNKKEGLPYKSRLIRGTVYERVAKYYGDEADASLL